MSRLFGFSCLAWLGLFLGLIPSGARCENRTYDGSGNNLLHPTWGTAGTQLERRASAAYDDGVSLPRGVTDPTLPNPRTISNAVVSQTIMMPNTHQMTD